MNKILRAFVLPFVLFFTLSTVTAPARAVLPVIAAGVAFITEGGMAANGLAALTVGTVAGMIYLGNLQTGAGTEAGSFMEIPLSTSRNRPLTLPPGYTAGANNDAQPVPPGTITPSLKWASDNVVAGQYFDTAQALCSAVNATDVRYGPNVRVDNPTTITCTNAGYVYPTATLRNTCPVGYTLSGSNCTLSNAAAVMKPADGRCQILLNVAGFTIDPNDPECGQLATNTSTTVTPTKITNNKPGSLTNGEVAINGDGSRTITYRVANTTNNTTTITTINMIPASGGQTATITGSSTVVVAGTGTAAGTAPVAPPITFPDDYNREITQGQIKTGVDTLHGDLDSSAFAQPAAPPVPADLATAENKKITDELGTTVAAYDNFKMLDWSTWIPTLPASSCTPFTGNVLGRPVSINLCPKIAMLNELLGWLLSVFALWSVVSMMFRKD